MAQRVVRTKEQFMDALDGNLRATFRLPVTSEHIKLATAGDAGHCPIILAAANKLRDMGLTLTYAKLDMYEGDTNKVDRKHGQPQLRFRIKEFPSVRYALPLPEKDKPWVQALDENYTADETTIDFDLPRVLHLPERNTLPVDRFTQPRVGRPQRNTGQRLEREWE